MKRRIFIAILLPEELRIKLAGFQEVLGQFNLRWIKPENLHFTLAFIGWTEEDKIITIIDILNNIFQKIPPFLLRLIKIILGPNEKYPRMLWAIGEKEEMLEKIWQEIRKKLKESQIFVDERHPLKVHLTLARARGGELFGKKIDQQIDLNFLVKEIAIVESHLTPRGAEYQILERFLLKS